MFSLKRRKSQAVAELHFVSNNDKQSLSRDRVWLSSEDIEGYVLYKLPPGVQFSHSKVVLKGMLDEQSY